MSKPWRPKRMDYLGGSSTSCRIWNIEVKSEDGIYSARLIDGLVNNITASNLNQWVEIQETGYLLLNIQASGSNVSSFSLEFSISPPDPIEDAPNLPPSNFKMFLARIQNYSILARFSRPLSITPVVTLIIGIIPTEPFQDNSERYYTWQINEI